MKKGEYIPVFSCRSSSLASIVHERIFQSHATGHSCSLQDDCCAGASKIWFTRSTRSAWTARHTWSGWSTWTTWYAWSTWSTGSTWSARSTRSTWSTWSTWSTRSARSTWSAVTSTAHARRTQSRGTAHVIATARITAHLPQGRQSRRSRQFLARMYGQMQLGAGQPYPQQEQLHAYAPGLQQ